MMWSPLIVMHNIWFLWLKCIEIDSQLMLFEKEAFFPYDKFLERMDQFWLLMDLNDHCLNLMFLDIAWWFCGAVDGFIVVDMNCGSIWIYLPPGEISRVACRMDGLDGYGFGGVVVEIVGGDDMRWWTFHGKARNDEIFVGNDYNFVFINNIYWYWLILFLYNIQFIIQFQNRRPKTFC